MIGQQKNRAKPHQISDTDLFVPVTRVLSAISFANTHKGPRDVLKLASDHGITIERTVPYGRGVMFLTSKENADAVVTKYRQLAKEKNGKPDDEFVTNAKQIFRQIEHQREAIERLENLLLKICCEFGIRHGD